MPREPWNVYTDKLASMTWVKETFRGRNVFFFFYFSQLADNNYTCTQLTLPRNIGLQIPVMHQMRFFIIKMIRWISGLLTVDLRNVVVSICTCSVHSRSLQSPSISTTLCTYTWGHSTRPSPTAVTTEMGLCSLETQSDRTSLASHIHSLVVSSIYNSKLS